MSSDFKPVCYYKIPRDSLSDVPECFMIIDNINYNEKLLYINKLKDLFELCNKEDYEKIYEFYVNNTQYFKYKYIKSQNYIDIIAHSLGYFEEELIKHNYINTLEYLTEMFGFKYCYESFLLASDKNDKRYIELVISNYYDYNEINIYNIREAIAKNLIHSNIEIVSYLLDLYKSKFNDDNYEKLGISYILCITECYKNEDTSVVKELLYLDYKNDYNLILFLLKKYAKVGNIEMIEWILNFYKPKHKIISHDDVNEPVMRNLCKSGNVDSVRRFMEIYNIELKDMNYKEIFEAACNNVNMIKFLLSIDNAFYNLDFTYCFHYAMYENNFDIMKYLISIGFDISDPKKYFGPIYEFCTVDVMEWYFTNYMENDIDMYHDFLNNLFSSFRYESELSEEEGIENMKYLLKIDKTINIIDGVNELFSHYCYNGYYKTICWFLSLVPIEIIASEYNNRESNNEYMRFNKYCTFIDTVKLPKLRYETDINKYKNKLDDYVNILKIIISFYKIDKYIDYELFTYIKDSGLCDDEIYLYVENKYLYSFEKEIKYKIKNAVNKIENFLFKCYYGPNGINTNKILDNHIF